MGRDTIYEKREFLNKIGHEKLASILARVESCVSSQFINIDADITIADCNRFVTLEFSFFGEDNNNNDIEEEGNLIYKIDLLYNTIKEFRDNLKNTLKREKERIKQLRIKEEQKKKQEKQKTI